MDLIQEGNMGLLEAIESFDISKKVSFSTYAYPIIYHSILDAINHQSDLIYVSQYNKKTYDLKTLPSVSYSLDYVYQSTGKTLMDQYPSNCLSSPIKNYLTWEQKIIIQQSLNQLKIKNKQIIILYYGLYGNEAHTYQQIGQIFNISKSAVYQKIKYLLQKLVLIQKYYQNIN